jgi:hypothetical protein
MHIILSLVILLISAAQPLAASAEDVELGYNGGDTRLDNYYYGTWVENANHTYAVCGGETPFVSAISVHEEGLFDNSARCSAYAEPLTEFDVPSYVAQPAPNSGGFSPKVHHVSDCGAGGVVLGVAQPGGDLAARWGTPVLCGVAPTPPTECRVVETPGDETDVARDASESGAYDWTDYPAVTCGPGRYARAVAYRDYLIGNIFVATRSWAVGGLICCSM